MKCSMDAAMTKPRDHDIPIPLVRETFDLDPTSPSGLRWRTRPPIARVAPQGAISRQTSLLEYHTL